MITLPVLSLMLVILAALAAGGMLFCAVFVLWVETRFRVPDDVSTWDFVKERLSRS